MDAQRLTYEQAITFISLQIQFQIFSIGSIRLNDANIVQT